MRDRRGIIILMMYLLLFAIIFFVALYSYHKNSSLLDLGFSAEATNILLMALSFAGVAKTVFHIFRN